MTTVGQGDLKFEPVENWPREDNEVSITEAVGVAVDSQDRVFVFNRGEPPVIVFDREGRLINAWGRGQFVRPHGIWIASDDTLYLTDDNGHSVKQFTAEGQLLRTIGPSGQPSDTGVEGIDYRTIERGAPPFNLPTNTLVASTGEIFVSDGYGNARVHKYSAEGELIKSWGEPGVGNGQFQLPHGIGIDRDDRIYIADRENRRIQIFSSDGNFIEAWTDILRPCEVFVAADNLVYVAELGERHGLFPWMTVPPNAVGGRVSIFDLEGNLLSRWGGGHDASLATEFYAPHDLWVDSEGSIYVGEVAVTAASLEGKSLDGLPTLRKFTKQN